MNAAQRLYSLKTFPPADPPISPTFTNNAIIIQSQILTHTILHPYMNLDSASTKTVVNLVKNWIKTGPKLDYM